MIEGTTVTVSPKNNAGKGVFVQSGQSYTVDTSNILFICAGAFVGLDKIISDRVNRRGSIGFGMSKDAKHLHKSELLELVEPEDVIKYGFIPEFVGRLPCFASAAELTANEKCLGEAV